MPRKMPPNDQGIKIAKLTNGNFLIGMLRQDDTFLGYKLRQSRRWLSLCTGSTPLLIPFHNIFSIIPVSFLDGEDVLKICDAYYAATWKKTRDNEPKFIAQTGPSRAIAWFAGRVPSGVPLLIPARYWRIHKHVDDVITVKYCRDVRVIISSFLFWKCYGLERREQKLEFCAKTGNLIMIDGKNYTPDTDCDVYRIDSIEYELPELDGFMP